MDESQRRFWQRISRGRPKKVETPGPGQESVWDYPRPPRIETVARTVRIRVAGVEVARSDQPLRVCETASPPVYYLPPQDVDRSHFEPSMRQTHCEWKGRAIYWDVRVGQDRIRDAAWSYPEPQAEFAALRDHLAFFPGRVEAWLDDERVRPQPGPFYGGWVTSEIVGPFKGEPGTEHW